MEKGLINEYEMSLIGVGLGACQIYELDPDEQRQGVERRVRKTPRRALDDDFVLLSLIPIIEHNRFGQDDRRKTPERRGDFLPEQAGLEPILA